MTFEINQGQIDPHVRFLARGDFYTLFLSDDRATFALHASRRAAAKVVELRWADTQASMQPVGIGEVATRSNYYFGKNPSQWHAGIPHYSQVRYRGIYPGIDMVFHGEQRAVEYDFVVRAGADPSRIGLEVSGAKGRRIDEFGNVVLVTSAGNVLLHRPTIYQEGNGGRTIVPGGYVLARNGQLRFRIGHYDKKRELVIDPVLTYATYLGANNTTQILAIAADSSGSAYVTGQTAATNFPTKNPVQANNAGSANAFVTKFNAAGTAIVYSTYFGGTQFDSGTAIVVDSSGDAYIAGSGSSGLTTTPGAFIPELVCSDQCSGGFVAKFNPSGTLGFSTFVGASSGVLVQALAVDANGNSYITGGVSSGLPLVNPLQTTVSTVFIQELNATGTAVEYSTYFGTPTAADLLTPAGIAVDSLGSIYIVGTASSPYLTAQIPLANPLQAGPAGQKTAFMSKLSPGGASLVYSTYFGGSGGDQATAAAVDSSGDLYVIGLTASTDFPLTPNAIRSTCGLQGTPADSSCQMPQVFAVKLDPTGTQVIYSTFLGGGYPGFAEEGLNGGLALDAMGDAFICGSDADPSFPVSNAIENSFQMSQAAVVGGDAFVTELDPSGALLMSTFLGGQNTATAASGIALDPQGDVYVSGSIDFFPSAVDGNQLLGPDFPLLNPFQQTLGTGLYTGFVAKISPANSPVISLSPLEYPLAKLRNMGTATLMINSIKITSPLTYGSDCGSSLAPGGECTFVFSSPEDGEGGGLTISSNAPGSPQEFSVEGTVSPVLLDYSPSGLSFGTVEVGTTSPQQSMTVSNPAPVPVNISSIEGGSPFPYTTNCPATLAPAMSCSITVAFSPTAAGLVQGAIGVVHDPNSTTDRLGLGGTGIQDSIAVSTQSLAFGTQYTASTPLPRLVTLTNVSSVPVTITSVATTGDFSETNTCGSPLPAASTCQVTVSFVPTINEQASGTLAISHTGTGGPENIVLYGVGAILSDLMLSPLQLAFDGYTPGTVSPPSTVVLTNTSTASMSISNVVATSEFQWTTNCPATLSSSGTCNVYVSFAPLAQGTFSGTLSVYHSGVGSPQVIPLTGVAQYPLALTPSQINFGNQSVGITSGWNYVSMGNNSGSPITIISVGTSGDFQVAQDPCLPSIAPRTGCVLQLTFTPTATGTLNGTLNVLASDDPSPHVVSLTGVGTPAAVTLSPASWFFGTQLMATSSAAGTASLSNIGTNPLTISSIAISGSNSSDFGLNHNCPISPNTLAAGSGCTLQATFSPQASGPRKSSISISHNLGTQTVFLTGVGAAISAAPSSLTFGSQPVGTASAPMPVVITNVGATSVSLYQIALIGADGGDFSLSNTGTCGSSLGAGAKCTVNVIFSPGATGSRTASLTIGNDGGGSPQAVAIMGTGTSQAEAHKPRLVPSERLDKE